MAAARASAATFLARILAQFSSSKLKGRSLQLSIDSAILYNFLPPPPAHSPPPPSEETNPFNFIFQPNHSSSQVPLHYQASRIRKHLFSQARTLLATTHEALAEKNPTHTIEEFVRQRLNFCPRIAPSGIPGAGRGVFVEGSVRAGDVISIYPGASYLPSQMRLVHGQGLEMGDYCISRYDGVMIDGSIDVEIDVSQSLPSTGGREDSQLVHPFANAHIINHPAAGSTPNALQFMLDIDTAALPTAVKPLVPVQNSDLPVSYLENLENLSLRQRVPGVEFFVQRPADRVLRTVVIVALKDLADEEVFIDYRFNPEVQWPKWYVECKGGGGARRWTKTGVVL